MARANQLGNSNLLAEVGTLVERWHVTRQAAFRLLRALRVPMLHIKDQAYFNMFALEKAIYYLSRHSGDGFAAPGSEYKNKDRHKNKKLGDIRIELTDKDLEEMNSSLFMAEYLAMSSKSVKPAAITNFTSLLKAKERAKKND